MLDFVAIIECIIILNGEISQDDISLLKYFEKIKIAADGAANKLYKNKIDFNYIIGDFDSFELINTKAQHINIPTQEKYDFEKCLDFVLSKKFKNVLVIGMNGGLIDHTLNNWSIFIKYSNKLNLYCYAINQIGVLISNDISFNSKIDDIISIIPIPKATLTTDGLMWNLYNSTLEFGQFEGARNKAIKEHISIKLHSGKYILFRKY